MTGVVLMLMRFRAAVASVLSCPVIFFVRVNFPF